MRTAIRSVGLSQRLRGEGVTHSAADHSTQSAELGHAASRLCALACILQDNTVVNISYRALPLL